MKIPVDKYVCYTWGECPVLWSSADWTWDECQLVVELVEVGAKAEDPPWLKQPWEPETWDPFKNQPQKQEKLIEILCKIKGEEYKKTINKKDFKITINEVKLLIKKVLNVDLIVEVKNKEK